MAPIPFFTKPELTQAFALILPPEVAAKTAEDWWRDFAVDVDANGYLLYEDPLARLSLPKGTGRGMASANRRLSAAQREEQERALWGGMSIPERRELLMSFSGFHLALLALVSDELYERMRVARDATPTQADKSRRQMRRIVAAIQAQNP